MILLTLHALHVLYTYLNLELEHTTTHKETNLRFVTFKRQSIPGLHHTVMFIRFERVVKAHKHQLHCTRTRICCVRLIPQLQFTACIPHDRPSGHARVKLSKQWQEHFRYSLPTSSEIQSDNLCIRHQGLQGSLTGRRCVGPRWPVNLVVS